MKSNNFKIGNYLLSESKPKFIISEIGLTHEGQIEKAFNLIDTLSKTGVHAIKFQMHIANEESTTHEKFRVNFSNKYKTRYDYWKYTEFNNEEWYKISNHCKKKKLKFLCTPFSIKAAEILLKLDIDAFKIGSGEFDFYPLINFIKSSKKPILLSTGMSYEREIIKTVDIIKRTNKYAIFHCTSMYPTPPKYSILNFIEKLKDTFNCPIGYSDHSGNIFSSLIALGMGISLLEVHVCDKRMKHNPDSTSSITINELKQLIKINNEYFTNKFTKNEVTKKLKKNRRLFSRSLSPKKNLLKNHIISESDIAFKKPGTGIELSMIKKIIGKKLKKNVNKNMHFKVKDFYE